MVTGGVRMSDAKAPGCVRCQIGLEIRGSDPTYVYFRVQCQSRILQTPVTASIYNPDYSSKGQTSPSCKGSPSIYPNFLL